MVQIATNRLAPTDLSLYIFISAAFLLMFSFGYFSKIKIKNSVINIPKHSISRVASVLVCLVYSLLFLKIFSLNETLSFIGYGYEYDASRRGQLSTLCLTAMWWYVFFARHEKHRLEKTFFLLIVAASAINLLSLGTRQAVIAVIIMYLLNKYSEKIYLARFKFWKIALIIGALGLLFGYIGIWRQSEQMSFDAILFILLAEPIFVFAGVFSFFHYAEVYLVGIPSDFLASLVAMVPSFIFPTKSEFIDYHSDIPHYARSGFGAINHIILMIANFGVLIAPFVAFWYGYYLAVVINKMKNSNFWYAAGISIISLIPFTFFRDGYATSVKLIVFNFIVTPLLLVAVDYVLKKSTSKSRNALQSGDC